MRTKLVDRQREQDHTAGDEPVLHVVVSINGRLKGFADDTGLFIGFNLGGTMGALVLHGPTFWQNPASGAPRGYEQDLKPVLGLAKRDGGELLATPRRLGQ